MVKATLMNIPKPLRKNRFFSTEVNNAANGVNDGFIELKKVLKKNNIDLSTQDINPPDKSKVLIWINSCSNNLLENDKQLNYLITQEPETVNKSNWDMKSWEKYNRIFCWNPDYLRNKKVYFLPFAYFWSPYHKNDWHNRKGFMMLIANCKHFYHQKSLTEKRISLIKWLAKYHPNSIDVYGRRWDEHAFHGFFRKYLVHLPQPMRSALKSKQWSKKVYRGSVINKVDTLKKYRFAVCFENSNYPGFLTEKIFHCFATGSVPIYWGALNINQMLPKNSFIDASRFNSYSDLLDYLDNYSEKDYMKFLNSINSFSVSKKAQIFSPHHYAKVIKDSIESDIKRISNI